MGALCNDFNFLLTHVARSTNKEDVLEFMTKLARTVEDPRNTVIVMDNHQSHKSIILKKFLIEKGFII